MEVLKILTENGHLIKEEDIVHSYPHDWRTHKPVIFRATKQWFCSIEPIRDQLINEIHNVKWQPAWGETRMVNMIKDRADWCISRQRAWGVPLPIIYCEDGTPIIEKEVFDNIENVIRNEGSDAWYLKDVKELLPNGYKNEHSPNGLFTKEKDIMDVWFDSGSSWAGVLKERNEKYPADLYLEGSDQYRGWFNSSLILSVGVSGVSPYKECVSHGFVMDENWEKMSKSKGNGIDPLKIINVYGADTLRLWASLVDYQQDVRISESIIKTISEQYRKIRNTFKFLLGNISTFDKNEKIEVTEKVDLYLLALLESTKNEYLKSFDKYNFLNGMNKLLSFISNDLSSFYLDIAKDILYCESKDSLRRKQVVYCLNECLRTLMILLNPVLPFTMDEVNSYYEFKDFDNVMEYKMLEITNNYDPSLINEYQKLRSFRDDVFKQIEVSRNNGIIKSSQEAKVIFNIFDNDTKNIINNISHNELLKIFIVSEIKEDESLKDNKGNACYCVIKHHEGIKCSRCWNYFDKENIKEVEGENLCPRCLKAIKQ